MKLHVLYKPGHRRDHGPEALYVAKGLQRLGYEAEVYACDTLSVCVAVMCHEGDLPDPEQSMEIGSAVQRLTAQWIQITTPAPGQDFQP